jgi:hypothetical protein
MDRRPSDEFEAMLIGIGFGAALFYRFWIVSFAALPALHALPVRFALVYAVALPLALLMFLGWRQANTAVCCWGTAAGALVLFLARDYLATAWDRGHDALSVKAASFLIALAVALPFSAMVSWVLSRSGPSVESGIAVVGSLGFVLAMLFWFNPLL